MSLRDFDQDIEEAGFDGYRPITNVLWTWLRFGTPTDNSVFAYLLAASRRLDGAALLSAEVAKAMPTGSEPFIRFRSRAYRALSLAEIMTVALGRALGMLASLPEQFGAINWRPLPTLIGAKRGDIIALRDCFEHIEERSRGLVRGKPNPAALSAVEQTAFLEWRLVYGGHSLDLRAELPPLLITARQYIYEVAVDVAGAETFEVASPKGITFFEP